MVQQTITKAFLNAKKITLNSSSKFILFSDCHRGDNSYTDDFTHNQEVYLHALEKYYDDGFTYIEMGDGIELWENTSFTPIFKAHKHVFLLMKKFYDKNRMHLLWGNHDMVFRNPKKVDKILGAYYDEITSTKKELFKGLVYDESILLTIENTDKNIIVMHGHQADFFNYHLWRLSRFLVQVLWKPLQLLGIDDPTSPAKNHIGLIHVEKRIKKWILNNNNQMLIAGHTHRPRFPEPGDVPYFNDGSCVHPRSITGLEIENLEISLIKWHIDTKDDGTMQIVRTILEGPENISHYI